RAVYLRVFLKKMDPVLVAELHKELLRSHGQPGQTLYIHYVDSRNVEPWLTPGGTFQAAGARTLPNGRYFDPTVDDVMQRVRYQNQGADGKGLYYNDWGM